MARSKRLWVRVGESLSLKPVQSTKSRAKPDYIVFVCKVDGGSKGKRGAVKSAWRRGGPFQNSKIARGTRGAGRDCWGLAVHSLRIEGAEPTKVRRGRDQFASRISDPSSNERTGGRTRTRTRTDSFTFLSLAPLGNFPAHLSLSPLPFFCRSRVCPSVHVGRISFFAKVSLALARRFGASRMRCCRSGSLRHATSSREMLARSVSERLWAWHGAGRGQEFKRIYFCRL